MDIKIYRKSIGQPMDFLTINVPLFKKLRDKMSLEMAQKVIVPKKN
jgi:hypothetical protein